MLRHQLASGLVRRNHRRFAPDCHELFDRGVTFGLWRILLQDLLQSRQLTARRVGVALRRLRASVPQTEISIPTPNGAWRLNSPKDTVWSNVVVSAKPDGSFHMSIGTVTSKNDADVIAAVAAANAGMANSAMALGGKALDAAVSAATKAAGVP